MKYYQAITFKLELLNVTTFKKYINIYNISYPPKIARNGRTGLCKALAKYSNSFFIKKPDALWGRSTPTIELISELKDV